jgi:putative (di)nucleoside polyphosphate hydrolase
MSQHSDFFRANVGAMIINKQGDVLVFQRTHPGNHAWQLPQGGLEPGEDPINGVMREVGEETGIPEGKLKLLAEASEWLAYELPEQYRSAKTGRGQVQKWFLFRFRGRDEDIQPDGHEFAAWQWMDCSELLRTVVAFRRPVYERLLKEFRSYLARPS